MKAYGLAVRLRNSLGLRTEVASENGSEEANVIRIKSNLEPTQINHLQALVGEAGWELAYKDSHLVCVPSDIEC